MSVTELHGRIAAVERRITRDRRPWAVLRLAQQDEAVVVAPDVYGEVAVAALCLEDQLVWVIAHHDVGENWWRAQYLWSEE